MKSEVVTSVLNMTIMVLVSIVLIAAIAMTITNTIYYKKLWDDNGSTSVTEETAKVMFFLNLFLAIVSGVVFFIFIYKWYQLYNIAKTESDKIKKVSEQVVQEPYGRMNWPKMTQRQLNQINEERELLITQQEECSLMLDEGEELMSDDEMYRHLGQQK